MGRESIRKLRSSARVNQDKIVALFQNRLMFLTLNLAALSFGKFTKIIETSLEGPRHSDIRVVLQHIEKHRSVSCQKLLYDIDSPNSKGISTARRYFSCHSPVHLPITGTTRTFDLFSVYIQHTYAYKYFYMQ